MRLFAIVAFLVALASVAVPVEIVAAEPGPTQLVSKDALEQADFAETPALSADGRYVAFRSSIGGREGIFRKDLQTGQVIPVLTGSASAPTPESGASEPSISADGRYVAFTTTASLDPVADDPPPPAVAPKDSDVYVADLSTSPPTYELASALNGSSTGLTYGSTAGARATGRVALSASGRQVVFVTRASSNLTGDPAKTETPEGQVVMRDLETETTTLVSVARNPLTGEMEPGIPVAGGAVMGGSNSKISVGASISADGSTIAWLGAHLPAQVPLGGEEEGQILTDDGAPEASRHYDEPLWRRVADGPQAPTRRIVGPLPGLPTNVNPLLEACSGAVGWDIAKSSADFVPKLSADGQTVALLGEPDGFANVYLVDMAARIRGSEGIRQLTREVPTKEDNACLVGSQQNLPGAGDISGVAISPDADVIAFTTQRQQFPLAPPSLIGEPPSGMGLAELYAIDLEAETLQRLTHGMTEGEPSLRLEEGDLHGAAGANSVSIDDSGEKFAFASRASNLVPGDGNGESTSTESAGSDAFLVTDPRSAPTPGATSLSAPPPSIQPHPAWRLIATASSRPDGSVRVAVTTPGSGQLRARAAAMIAAGRPPRTVALASRHVSGSTVMIFSLEPARGYRRLVRSQAGLEAKLTLGFTGPGGRPLKETLAIRFRARRGRMADAREGGEH